MTFTPQIVSRPRKTLFSVLLAAALTGLAMLAGFTADASADTVSYTLTAKQKNVEVAPGVTMRAWTFNDTVPGPVVRATEGDTVEITLVNGDQGVPARTEWRWKKVKVKKKVKCKKGSAKRRKGKKCVKWVKKKKKVKVRIPAQHGHPHSIDFHAAQIAPNVAFKSIPPGQSHTFSFVAERPGVYVYHCGTNSMLEHIAMGMYGAIVVDPAVDPDPRGVPDKEITVVQSEFYGQLKGDKLIPSHAAMTNQYAKYVVFNGKANRYVQEPIEVPAGDLLRINFVDAGPNLFSAFHVVGGIFESFWPDGNPDNHQSRVSTQPIAPGGAGVFDIRLAEPGNYPMVTHSMKDMEKGAMAMIRATEP